MPVSKSEIKCFFVTTAQICASFSICIDSPENALLSSLTKEGMYEDGVGVEGSEGSDWGERRGRQSGGLKGSPFFLYSNRFLFTSNIRLAITKLMGSMQKVRYSEEGLGSF